LLAASIQPADFFGAMGMKDETVPQTWFLSPDGDIMAKVEGALDAASAKALGDRIVALMAAE
jgi:hypothetical protein